MTHAKQLQTNFRLIAMTQPVDEMKELGVTTPLELIAFCARVSNPKNQLNSATAGKLIKSLVARSEWSPLEQVDLTFEIITARDITRQILRHKSFSPQEFSQRYAEVDESQFCTREARIKHDTDRQSSVECTSAEDIDWWLQAQLSVLEVTQGVYREALKRNFAKEVARVVLPEGLTLSTLYMKGSIRSWIHYLALRNGNGTQKEHQQIALGISAAVSKLFPVEEVTGG